ncbi:MAG: hypothetical protein OK422_05975 [Thaumarchaeota archaeon]|nr:hypothetical protein [Nitrososphaerota archaeon]
MTSKIGLGNRFHWGLNIDDIWTYAGVAIPKSIVIPYLFSTRFRGGPFTLPRGREGPKDKGKPQSLTAIGTRGKPDAARPAEILASFLKKGGVDFVRCWFQWNFFEKSIREAQHNPSSSAPWASPTDFHFPLDEFVSRMTEAGIGIIGVIGSGYSRFLPIGLQTDRLDEYVSQLTDSSTEIVRHYKDKVKVWQIENEPNWWKAHYFSHWRRGVIWLSAESQKPILSALNNVVRSECPGATIIVNLEADEKVANWKLFAKYSDILGLDFYPNYLPRTPIHPSKLGTVALQVRKGTGLPIFVIETGYPTGPRLFGYDEVKQCQYIRNACETAFTCDAITGLGWFRFSDSYWKSFPPQENYFGLLTKEGRPKAGWNEYVNQVRQRR